MIFKSSDYIAGPKRVGTVPLNILQFDHSYAYDCKRYYNVCVADPNTIIFASGNFIHFLDVTNVKISFRRSYTGNGIGHITKNPNFDHIAVGENGIDPPIIIYNWPSMEIVTILLEGSTRNYSHLSYSPDGSILVSQGGEPDHLITIWNWQQSTIMLKCKSHGQDVYNVMFSPFIPGDLTTSGSGHIKFWKMAETFTGLKLKGELGRFGKTEISDIHGIYSMPDKKVLSSCEWGNILLWDEGLIKVEVCRRNRQVCHTKPITQFEYIDGHLISIGNKKHSTFMDQVLDKSLIQGMDGWIRFWWYENIDHADPPDEDRFLEIEPVREINIIDRQLGESSIPMQIQRKEPKNPKSTFWYVQDGNGGIWLIDLNHSPNTPKKLFPCHAGPINDMAIANWGPLVSTLGQDGRLHIYNYIKKTLILSYQFQDVGRQIIWFPCEIEATGSTLVCAFGSGIVRMVTINTSEVVRKSLTNENNVKLIQVMKPHTLGITVMSLNASMSLLVTGSEDSTIFTFSVQKMNYPILLPIGYIKTPSLVTCITWKPDRDTTCLVGCMRGECMEIDLPNTPRTYTTVSYELVRSEPKTFKFHSVKSSIRVELIKLKREKEKEIKLKQKMEELKKLREENPGIDIDEETFFTEIEEEEAPLPEIYIPETPNPVLALQYTDQKTIWLLMGGFDAGYIYEYPNPDPKKPMRSEPMRSVLIHDADDTEISTFLFYKNNKYLFLAMQHGEIRVCRVNPNDRTDLSNYWLLSIHDNDNGYIPKILLNYDQQILLTCGHDGNLFSYRINDETPHERVYVPRTKRRSSAANVKQVEDITDSGYPSLEQTLLETEQIRISSIAQKKKSAVYETLRQLTEEFNHIVSRNENFPTSIQITSQELELDPRIKRDLDTQLHEKMSLLYRKLAFDVETSQLRLNKLLDHFITPITSLPFAVCRILKPRTMVLSLRERKPNYDFHQKYREIEELARERKITNNDEIKEKENREISGESDNETEGDTKKVKACESFLKGLSPYTIEFGLGVQINQMLRRYRARKIRSIEREKQWKEMNLLKPSKEFDDTDKILAIEKARETLGDYKLKTSPNFDPTKEKTDAVLSKYRRLLEFRQKLHKRREDFNIKLRSLRTRKLTLINGSELLIEKLKEIQTEIHQKYFRPLPFVPTFDSNIEMPEHNLELDETPQLPLSIHEEVTKFVSQYIAETSDDEYEVLITKNKPGQFLEGSSHPIPLKKKQKTKTALKPVDVDPTSETIWEKEMRLLRITKQTYRQNCIIDHIKTSYENFDAELDVLERERSEIVADSIYLELILITFHQEFIILKKYETVENDLRGKVHDTENELAVIKQKSLTTNLKIEQRNKIINKVNEKIREVSSEYLGMIVDDKFYEFLRKIFKRKFKEPKVHGDDETESSSSSSVGSDTSSEDDLSSIDSRNMNAIHFDESICPPGCNKELYNKAFIMRQQRYEYEQEIREHERCIDGWRRENDKDFKTLKSIEKLDNNHKEQLKALMIEKQHKLNEIEITLIVKFHQLQLFETPEELVKIENCVLFDSKKLTGLYSRVEELKIDALNEQLKHKQDNSSYYQMKLEYKSMNAKKKQLLEQIEQEMINKFGRQLSLTTLYEVVLRRKIANLKADSRQMIDIIEQKITCVEEQCDETLILLKSLIRNNTDKLNFLTVLEEEQFKLRKIMKQRHITEEEMVANESQYNNDLMKLETIIRKQKEEKHMFINDIENMKLISKSLPCTQIDALQVEKMYSEQENLEQEEISLLPQESHFKSMIRQLLSTVLEDYFANDADKIAKDVIGKIKFNLTAANILETNQPCNKIVDEIVKLLPPSDEHIVENITQSVQESLDDIFSRIKEESKNSNESKYENFDMKIEMENLLTSVNIKGYSQSMVNEIIELLKNSDGINDAIEYLLENLPSDMDNETKRKTMKDVRRVLTKLQLYNL